MLTKVERPNRCQKRRPSFARCTPWALILAFHSALSPNTVELIPTRGAFSPLRRARPGPDPDRVWHSSIRSMTAARRVRQSARPNLSTAPWLVARARVRDDKNGSAGQRSPSVQCAVAHCGHLSTGVYTAAHA